MPAALPSLLLSSSVLTTNPYEVWRHKKQKHYRSCTPLLPFHKALSTSGFFPAPFYLSHTLTYLTQITDSLFTKHKLYTHQTVNNSPYMFYFLTFFKILRDFNSCIGYSLTNGLQNHFSLPQVFHEITQVCSKMKYHPNK